MSTFTNLQNNLRWALLGIGLLFGTLSHAQQLLNVTVRVTNITNVAQCNPGCDGGVIIFGGCIGGSNPDPRFRFETGYNGANYQPVSVWNPGDNIPCGPTTINLPQTVGTFSDICVNTINIRVESWEEDGCGADNSFDNGGGCINSDEGQALDNFQFTIPAGTSSGTQSQTFTQTQNGNVFIAEISWSPSTNNVPGPTVNNATPTICSGQQFSFGITSAGNSFRWFDNTGSNVGNGTSFTTLPLINNGASPITVNYSVVTIPASGCPTLPTPLTVTVFPNPSAPTFSPTNVTGCFGTQTTINATTGGANGTFTWYADAAATTIAGSGTSFRTQVLNGSPLSYWLEETNSNGCPSPLVQINVSTLPAPVDPTAGAVTAICAGQAATLTATVPAGTIEWYADASGIASAATGSPFTTPNLAQATTYYLGATGANGCKSNLIPVTIPVNPAPNQPVASDASICAGQQATLTAIGQGGALSWFDDLAGTIPASTTPNTGNTVVTLPLNNNITYYVQETGPNGCLSPVRPVNVFVGGSVAAPSVPPIPPVCEGGSSTVAVVPTTPNGSIRWYYNGVMISTGAFFQTPSFLSAGTYTLNVAEESTAGCISSFSPASITITAAPSAPTAAGVSVCAGSAAVLNATAAGTINWYSDATLLNNIGTGAAFSTPALAQNTPYFVAQTDPSSGCNSAPAIVNVTVSSNPSASASVMPSMACEGSAVTLTSAGGVSYAWTGPNGFGNLTSGGVISAVALANAGTYQVIVTSADGCTTVASTELNVRALPPTPVVTPSSAVVCDSLSVDFTSNAAPGFIPYWANASQQVLGTGANFNTGILRVSQSPFILGLVVSDGVCRSFPAIVGVVIGANPVLSAIANNSQPAGICEGTALNLSVNATSGTIVNYAWSGPNGSVGANLSTYTNPSVNANADAGFYEVIATDANGCTAVKTTVADINPALPTSVTAVSIPNEVCEGSTVNLSADYIVDATYTWSFNGNIIPGRVQVINGATTANAGVYNLTVSRAGCTEVYAFAQVVVNAAPTIVVPATSTFFTGVPASVQARGASGYSWTSNPTVSFMNGSNNDATVAFMAPAGTYNLTVTGTSTAGCRASATSEVIIVPNIIPEADNIFTPNGDGANETLVFRNLENIAGGYTLTIVDRAGQELKVYKDGSYTPWDGTADGKNCPDGVYWWVVLGKDGNIHKGAVTLKR